MTDTLYLDLETRSRIDLKTCGAYRYFEDDSADVLIAAYAFGDGPVSAWTRGQPVPPEITAHVRAGGMVSGWNVFGFERLAFEHVLGPRYGWPVPRLEQFTDTMHMAAAMALPKALGRCATVLGLEEQKDKDGMRLIRKFSIPRKASKAEEEKWHWHMQACDRNIADALARAHACGDKTPLDYKTGLYWTEPEDDPADFARYVEYCRQDVATERAIRSKLVPLSASEQALTVLDARINSRGLRIDIASARAAIKLAEKAVHRINDEIEELTGGAVKRVTEAAKIKDWCATRGVTLAALDKAALDAALNSDLPHDVRRVMELRQEGGKTSVKKLDGFIQRAGADGRAKGNYTFHGAATGRWTSTGVNVANLPRPRGSFEDAHLDTSVLFRAFRSEDPDFLQMCYGEELGRPMHLISDAIRGFIWAAPGHRFIQADYSGIEGAVIAWLAREEWKVKALFDIMADPAIPDMYRQTAARILNLSTDVVTKKHWGRQAVGKVSELALGFQGGVAAFASMANIYRVDLDALHPPIWENATPEEREKATKRFRSVVKRKKEASDRMSEKAWIACELIKRGWRQQNSAIAASWHEAERAVREAVENPGSVTEAVRCRFVVRVGYLWMLLPSGRCLAYASPRLSSQVWACIRLEDGEWSDPEVMSREEAERLAAKGHCKIEGDTSPAVTFLSEDGVTKQWRRQALYGGLVVQNATQSCARDLLVNGILKAEAAGYPVVLHTYDELMAEVPNGFGDVKAFERLICELPDWAAGLPLTADGWAGKRYRK